ncbi:diguanylate cyclase (GGDEF)-like protein [Tamilnaduibacter salinus]|uniref:diguanylate cyclase n=1 Tax=Tamilnaduibacter salinus TaxID=1484056 RepID=A0A2U1CX39_9GAMM|nr:GGDEF domain-containing protein [Tamilnaduibacter salinus]PVY76789.1 diguanylate cyclase (GGDEF)-like protein [Tamilnaduibacter salinus]
MFYRFRNDFQLSIITLLGVSAVTGIVPFAVFRFWNGEVLAGLLDTAIVTLIIAGMTYAWVTGDSRRAGVFMCVLISAGAAAVAIVIGTKAIFWIYVVLVTSFFLAPPALATVCNLLMLGAVVLVGDPFDQNQSLYSFLATGIMVSCCAYVFGRRNEDQRIRLERLATHDPLTGAKNRRVMEEEMQAAISTFERNDTPHALVILDLDHFKTINDNHGHGVGDVVLRDVADLVNRHTRLSDTLFRFGGEEFVLLMPGVRPEATASVAENLRYKIMTELRGPRGSRITASFGVASLRVGESDDLWLERADSALYEAKTTGRNKVVVAERMEDDMNAQAIEDDRLTTAVPSC